MHRAQDAGAAEVRPLTIGWALRRALLGIAILFVVISTAAWLLYASIDPALEAQNLGTASANAATARGAGAGL